MVFTFQTTSDISVRKQILGNALDYLNELKDPEKIVNDHKAYEAFFFIGYSVAFHTSSIDMAVFSTKNIEILYAFYGIHVYYLIDGCIHQSNIVLCRRILMFVILLAHLQMLIQHVLFHF